MIIKIRYTSGGSPVGREYSYNAPDGVAVGSRIDIDGKRHGVVTAVNVPASEIEAFADRVKTINGIAKEEK